MSPLITSVLLICTGLYGLVIVIEFALGRRVKRFVLQLALAAVFLVALRFTTGFPTPSGRQSFGGASSLLAIGVMFVCTILGIAARYVFYLQATFSWLGLLKPLCVTPLVLLPLIGSAQASASLDATQLVSFAFLAFQNGFFWQMVLESSRPTLAPGPMNTAGPKAGKGGV